MEEFVVYLIVINIFAFFLYGIDKIKAKYNRWRISENALMLSALAGGFIGALAGMQVFRHKTRHMKFVIGVPVIAVLWIAVVVFVITRL